MSNANKQKADDVIEIGGNIVWSLIKGAFCIFVGFWVIMIVVVALIAMTV